MSRTYRRTHHNATHFKKDEYRQVVEKRQGRYYGVDFKEFEKTRLEKLFSARFHSCRYFTFSEPDYVKHGAIRRLRQMNRHFSGQCLYNMNYSESYTYPSNIESRQGQY